MVAVFNKEALSWYLITLKLKETVEANLRSNPNSPSTHPPPPPPPQTRDSSSSHLQPPQPPLLEPPPPPPPSSPPPPEPDWIISIREKVEHSGQEEESCPWAKLSIYRIPKTLRDGDKKAFVPQLVSLGPFHRGKHQLREMDGHKYRSLHRALLRTGHDLRLYLDAVRALEEKARSCYEGVVPISSEEFVECMVIDGHSCRNDVLCFDEGGRVFLLEVFRGVAGEGFRSLGYSRHDPVFAMRGAMHAIQRDMIMLENQIPLFVLDCLLALQLGQDPDRRGLVAPLAVRFFDPLMPTDEPLKKKKTPRRRNSSSHSTTITAPAAFDPLLSADGLHCLDVFRKSLLRTGPAPPPPKMWRRRRSNSDRVADRRRQQLVHCVTELRDAGVKFRRRNTDRFWDVKFEDGVLRVPRLLIHDGTRSMFLNLIAFEQCHMDITKNITSYIIFMDNLINSAEDVRYLHYCGIVEHWLGNDEEVADLFNRICQEVVFDMNDSYLSGLSEEVNKYYDHKWNAWRATLKHRYFSNPWAIMSVVAAVVLLFLTTAQTFYSVYAYYRPPS